jgi:glycosyltransferase involved in cell wall biosynthesis
VCYNAVDSVYRKLDGPLPVLDKFSIKGRYIYHISKYSLRKNPSCLLRAFAELSAQSGMSDLQLVISGSGWENGAVRSLLDDLDLREKVVFTGFTDELEVVQLYNGASVFLFPSRAEGYGMPNVEAMACGCPVVTTRTFAIPEIVGEAALLVDDPDDYTAFSKETGRILNDSDFRESMIRKGFEQVKRYSWTKSATTVLETYRKLLTQNP